MQVDAVRCEVALEREKYCASAAHDVGVSYFVLFRTARAATIAKQVVNVPNAHFEICPAPTPTAVCWSSLKPSAERTRYPVSVLAQAAYAAALFFYAIPIAFVSSLMNLDNLYAYLPFLETVMGWIGPTGEAFVEALLPTLALIVFMAILPLFCMWISGFERHASIGRTQAAAFVKFFRFQFVWSFLGLSIGASLLNSVQAILHQPSQILGMLSSGLANASTTFICLLIIFTCAQLPMGELARVVPVCIVVIKRSVGLLEPGETPPPTPVQYHVLWCKLMFSMTIGMAYSSIAPITTCFALAYVLVALALYKRNLLYIYIHAAEARGAFLPMGSGMLLLILGTAQLLLAAVHLAKGSFLTFLLLLPLLFFT